MRIKKLCFFAFLIGTVLYLVYFIPLRIKSDQAGLRYALGFTQDEKLIKLTSGTLVWVIEPGDFIQPYMKYVVFRGNFSQFDPKQYAVDADRYNVWIGLLEFNESLPFTKQILEVRGKKDQFFRVHTIRQEEVVKMKLDTKMFYHRLRRAILERSIDMIWIQPVENIDLDFVLSKLQREFGEPTDLPTVQKISNVFPFIPFTLLTLLVFHFSLILGIASFAVVFTDLNLAIFAVSILATVTTYFAVKNKKYLPILYLLIGLLTYAALSRFEFLNDLRQFRGVKLSLMALPFFVTLNLLFENRDLLIRYKKYLPYFAVAVGVAGFYYLWRSGNFAFVPNVERKARDFIESILWVRPRLKEVVGYPAFFISLSFSKNRLISFLQILGAIALVSTFNTFCHIKTPLVVSLYRSLFSILLGYITFYVLRRFVKC